MCKAPLLYVVLSKRVILQKVHETSEIDFNKWKLDMLSTIQSVNDQQGVAFFGD